MIEFNRKVIDVIMLDCPTRLNNFAVIRKEERRDERVKVGWRNARIQEYANKWERKVRRIGDGPG